MSNSTSSINFFEILKNSLLTYTVSATLIFVGGLNKNLLPISIVSFFYVAFSYAFTFTCFMILYGMKGILVGIFMLGVQGAVIIAVYVELGYQGIRYSILQQTKNIQMYGRQFLAGIIVICGISIVDALFQPLMQRLIYNIL